MLCDFRETLAASREADDTVIRAKSEFLSNMSHEIRTLLDSIFGMTEIVPEDQIHTRTARLPEYRQAVGAKRCSNCSTTYWTFPKSNPAYCPWRTRT